MFQINVDENLILKLRTGEDAEDFFKLTDRNREQLRRWLSWVDDTKSVEDLKKHIDESQQKFEDKTAVNLGIQFENNWVGMASLVSINAENHKAEVGYWLDKDTQGKGIMTKAVKAIVDYGFRELNLNRIFIRCATNNEKSAGVAIRLGFFHEGVLRQNEWAYDHFEDDAIYSILRSEWEKW